MTCQRPTLPSAPLERAISGGPGDEVLRARQDAIDFALKHTEVCNIGEPHPRRNFIDTRVACGECLHAARVRARVTSVVSHGNTRKAPHFDAWHLELKKNIGCFGIITGLKHAQIAVATPRRAALDVIVVGCTSRAE